LTTTLALAPTASIAQTTPAAEPKPADAAPPPANDPKADAMAHWKRGLELYEEQDFNNALIEFRKAYGLAPTYKVLYNIGQVCYQLTDYACALKSFEQYLKDGSGSIASDRRKEVEREIEKLRSRVGSLEIVTNVPGADVFVDDILIGKSPLPGTIIVSAGRRKIVISKQGHMPATRIVEVAGTDSMRVELPLADPAGKPAAVAESRPSKWTTLSTVGVGFAAVFAVGAGITGAAAWGASKDLEEQKFVGATPSRDFDDKSARVRTLSIASDVLLGAAVLTLGTTLVLTVIRSPAPERSPASVALKVSPTGLFLNGEF
jgi:hypothetical protein